MQLKLSETDSGTFLNFDFYRVYVSFEASYVSSVWRVHFIPGPIFTVGSFVSARDLRADVLLIPQACLGGKKKGNNMQYHQLVNKDLGRQLFEVGFLTLFSCF